MTGTEIQSLVDFENSLKEGDKVIIRWTNCGNYYAAPAIIRRINRASISANLNKEIKGIFGSYPIGHKITVPRFGLKTRWSSNNRVEPSPSAC